MYTLRTRIGKDIVAEFLPPASYWRRKKGKVYKDKVIILADGMPSVPSKRGLIDFLSRKGYWVFHPRYRGSWESGGTLFARSPHEDILLVVDALRRGHITELWDGKKFRIKPERLVLCGSSFGGAAVLIAGAHTRIDHIVAFSPVVDWREKSDVEPIAFLAAFTRLAFNMGYRVSTDGWKKIQSGRFFNPVLIAERIRHVPTLIVHAKDDDVVSYQPVEKFAKASGATLSLSARGGHMGLSTIMRPAHWKRIQKFLNA